MTTPRMSLSELNAWIDSIRARAEKLAAEMIAENEDTKKRWKEIEEVRKTGEMRTVTSEKELI